jgi:hypothetical protein
MRRGVRSVAISCSSSPRSVGNKVADELSGFDDVLRRDSQLPDRDDLRRIIVVDHDVKGFFYFNDQLDRD